MGENINYESTAGKARDTIVSELVTDASNPPTEKKLGIALVGLGKYSTEQLAPALLETKHCYLAGIVTGTESKVPEWKVKYNITDGNIYNYENFDQVNNNNY